MTRRQFVRAALVVGAGVAAGASVGCTGPGSTADSADTPSVSYGEANAMGKRVLVGYATRKGSTVGVAERIGETLARAGLRVDVRPLADRPDAAGHDAFVLGSAVNGANWLPEALDYVRSNRSVLARMPIAMFCVHAMNCGKDEAETAKRLAYLDEARSIVRPSAEGFFAGKGPSSEDTFWLALWAFRAFGGHVAEGDSRDWPKIEAWAQGLSI